MRRTVLKMLILVKSITIVNMIHFMWISPRLQFYFGTSTAVWTPSQMSGFGLALFTMQQEKTASDGSSIPEPDHLLGEDWTDDRAQSTQSTRLGPDADVWTSIVTAAAAAAAATAVKSGTVIHRR